jgi:acid phosphatase type 7
MKKIFLREHFFITLLIVTSASVIAQPPRGGAPGAGSPSDEVLEAISISAYQPSEMADRITLSISGDPSTEIAVNWRTSDNVVADTAKAEITLAVGSPDLKDTPAITRAVDTSPLETGDYTSYHHSVIFEDLEPNTKYAYRVGNAVLGADSEAETLWSEWAQFTTAASSTTENVTPFSFIYFGDAQNDLKSHWSRVIREAYSDMPEAAFMLHAGDLVNDRAGSDQEWGEWFYAGGWVNSAVPQIATPGNHEYTRDGVLTGWWRTHFAFPENGPEGDDLGLNETAYYFDYQGARFISIDSQAMESNAEEDIATAQVEWLTDVLSDNPNAWTIVYHHHPMWPAGNQRSQHPWLESKFKDIYDKFGVDLVLQGHDHTYARGDNVGSGLPYYKGDAGPVYVVSVAGSKMYVSDADWAEVASENLQLYQIIDVSNDQIRYRALTADGAAFDEFSIEAGSDNQD